jgi:RHS repeat-associated protein
VKFVYGYDVVGNLVAVNDSINGISAGVTGYSYDLLNRVTRLTQSGIGVQSKRVDLAYNAVNQLTGLSRYSGVNSVVDTSYVYDNNQRLIQLSHKKGASTVASYNYSYDNADKLVSTVSSVDGASSYGYDATNQLVSASHSTQTNEAYAYDPNGNRTSGGTVTSANNQLLSDGTYNYQYDGEGNRTRRTEIATGKVTEYVWDYRNRLAGVLFKDGAGVVTKTIDYTYDGNNQRIGKRIDGAVTERYVIDRNQIALVFDGVGVQTHRYLYGTAVDQVLVDETATGMVWALADQLGTVSDLVDNSGSVVNHISYDSFGKVVSQTNAGVGFRYGYTGREQDDETGLDYYRARYYDAGNGRFISEDPIGFEAGDTNLYRYVGNSPVNAIDPSGTITFAIPGADGFGNLLVNLFARVRRYGVYPLPGLVAFAIPAARLLLETIGKNEPIIVIAHSAPNFDNVPLLIPFIRAFVETSTKSDCNTQSRHDIYVGRLDPTGVPKFAVQGADLIIDVGSNNPGSKDPRDRAALNPFLLRPDFRAKKGVGHNGLLNDRDVLNKLQFDYGFPF